MTGNRLLCTALSAVAALGLIGSTAHADTTAQAVPFSQNWTNAGLITANDNWGGVPGITGFQGQDITTVTGTDPQTLLTESGVATNELDVIANQTNPNTLTNGGVAEFDTLTNPSVALQGSGTADAPYLLVRLNTTGLGAINVTYNVRDLDGGADNSIQQVAFQYRVGTTGNFTNVAAAYIPDATTGPNLATLVTPIAVSLPATVNNQPEVQIRIITTNAVGNDEWVGIDDLDVTGTTIVPLDALGEATPATVAQGGNTVLEVLVQPGSPPASTGIGVQCDLTAIGGSATQALLDDGNGADLFAADNIFTVSATVAAATTLGAKTLPCTVTDLQGRVDTTDIALTVTDAPTPPTGIGTATPSNITAGAATLLSVITTAGANPASTAIEVTCDTTPIGGGAGVALFDDGTHDDGGAGDGTYAFSVTSGASTTAGNKIVSCTVSDGQGRSSIAPIALTVVAVCGDGRVEGSEACDDGDLGNGDGCNAVCAVESGWTCAGTAPSVCTDIDECTLNTDDCVAAATCNDIDGGFTCTCPGGYAGDGELSGTGCTDIDECTLDTDDCVLDATCNDLDGSFSCTCPAGYAGDGELSGTGCTDIDECTLDTDDCVAGATCGDVDGDYTCTCPAGFTGDGEAGGTGCTDIDECALNTDTCVAAATCNDLDGSFACACPAGFAGNGQFGAGGTGCTDIDECALNTDDCVAGATCSDLDGSFACACPAGYAGNGRASGTGCTDIDECTLNTDDCVAGATCNDTDGSFTCACAGGYEGDGHAGGTGCDDIDECTIMTDTCSAFAACTNTVGSYGCTCNTGFGGDGFTCDPVCGDELIVAGEECDDAGTQPNDGCDGDCQVEDGWICDGTPSDCRGDCGDGLVRDAEECDDENNDNGDGCDAGCVVEPGYNCDTSEPSECSPSALCGDGALDGGEDCDDGNEEAEDGCDPTCEVEPGFACDDGEPSSCEEDGDGDGIGDSADNCPVDPNQAQTDSDGDGAGDVCDLAAAEGCCSTGGGDPTGAIGLALAVLLVAGRRRRRRA